MLDAAQGRASVARAAPQGGQCLIHVASAIVDRLKAMRGPGEDYSAVILRLAQLEASGS
jgi:hypothetical protein